MIETKAPILFQPSPGQSSVITAVLLTSKDCFIRLSQKHKIVLYLQMFQHAKLYISASTLLRSTIGERSPKLGVPVVTWGSCVHLSRDFAGVKNRDFLGGRAMCKICAILNFE